MLLFPMLPLSGDISIDCAKMHETHISLHWPLKIISKSSCSLYTNFIHTDIHSPSYRNMVWVVWVVISALLRLDMVRSRRCACLVTWFCYEIIAKPGDKTDTPSWPDPYAYWISHLGPSYVITHPCPKFNGSFVRLLSKLWHGWIITCH